MSTKLAPPNVEDAMARPRLFDLLDRSRNRPVIWVGAPAGSGKSTLVASYARARNLRCLWYGVDSRDADPGALFYYLGQGAEVHAAARTTPLPVLTMDHPAGTRGFARRFFEALFRRVEAGIVVFDDCQTLPATDRWYELVREGCEAVPSGISLVLISRSGPPPVLARLLASSRVSILGWDDLRLSPEEATELARERSQKLGLELSGEALTRLDADFGGWAAGVVLALECARFERKPDGRGLSSASQQLFDYFASEVFSAAEPKLKDFLLRSALLPTMTAAALDHMFGAGNGARLLARLKADNFFIREHGNAPAAYRYHPLFRDFLLQRAQEEWAAVELAQAQRRAAVALAESGESEAALELFLTTSDQDSAARLIVKEAPSLVQHGRGHTVCRWVDRLDPQRFAANPWLAFWAGGANLGSNASRAVAYCTLALDAFNEEENPSAYWLVWRTLTQAHQVEGNDLRRLRPLVERALAAHTRGAFASSELEASVLRSAALAMMGYAPDSPELANLAKRALSGPEGRDPEELMLALFFHGFRGELAELLEIVHRWELRVAREDLGPTIRFWLILAKVFGALVTGEFASAQALIRQGLEISERSGLFALNSGLLIYSAYGHAALGDTSALAIVVDEIVDLVEPGRRMDVANKFCAAGLEALLIGDLARARRHMADAVSIAERIGSPLAETLHRLGLVEVLLVSYDLSAAEEELARVRARVDPISCILAQSARLLGAQFALMKGHARAADDLLAEGLNMGAGRGLVPMPFPTRGTLVELARRARARGIATSYVSDLARKFELDLTPRRRSVSPAPVSRSSEQPQRVPSEFSKALRAALRHLHETRRLADNALLKGVLVEARTGPGASVEQRLSALRDLLQESVQELSQSARTEPSHRSLLHTYLDPKPTQLLAAESARMSFGTYRRHLAAGLDELAMALWLREQSLRASAVVAAAERRRAIDPRDDDEP